MKKGEFRLYHGSYCKVDKPDLALCRKGKDFGKGFYLTTSKEQASRFTKTAVLKASKDGRLNVPDNFGYVSEFKCTLSDSGLLIYEFKSADSDWLHCVAAYRKDASISAEDWDSYDIIIGKIANDRTNMVITAYLDGAYGEVGSAGADGIAISLLEPENLKDQYCFRTQESLKMLEFVDFERTAL